ncbi:MAG: hypothetical protein QOG91_390 [Candidatus Parcubacteria bacterium]|nr:hypothetical protein [Candidatus Parcubacteria bacterium]
MTKYAALLRGIGPSNPNMHGAKLRTAFEKMGFKRVETVIASGNVIFESASKNERILESRIEKALPRLLGFKSPTIVRSQVELEQIARKSPFGDMKADPRKYWIVTFLKHKPGKGHVFRDFASSGAGFTIFPMHDRVIFCSIDVRNTKTPEVMRFLEKKFGKEMTTRTWKTVKKILKKMEGPQGR